MEHCRNTEANLVCENNARKVMARRSDGCKQGIRHLLSATTCTSCPGPDAGTRAASTPLPSSFPYVCIFLNSFSNFLVFSATVSFESRLRSTRLARHWVFNGIASVNTSANSFSISLWIMNSKVSTNCFVVFEVSKGGSRSGSFALYLRSINVMWGLRVFVIRALAHREAKN